MFLVEPPLVLVVAIGKVVAEAGFHERPPAGVVHGVGAPVRGPVEVVRVVAGLPAGLVSDGGVDRQKVGEAVPEEELVGACCAALEEALGGRHGGGGVGAWVDG